nr:hypothetical protein KXZ65_06340 [Pectobacterium sp. PL152]
MFIPAGRKKQDGWEANAYPDVGSSAMTQFVDIRLEKALNEPDYYPYFYDAISLLLQYGASPLVDKMTGDVAMKCGTGHCFISSAWKWCFRIIFVLTCWIYWWRMVRIST